MTDRQLLDWLKENLPKSEMSQRVIARFENYSEPSLSFKHKLDFIRGAHKLAMDQMQHAQDMLNTIKD